MNCIICGSPENVKKLKHLPLSEGRNGHVTLSDWTEYCDNCAKQQGDLYTKQMESMTEEPRKDDKNERSR